MKFNLIVRKCGTPETWAETYTRNIEDPRAWGLEVIANFNKGLRPGEAARELVDVDVLDAEAGEHSWEKTNLITITTKNSLYDTYKCSTCGATGRRYGLNTSITRDRKYKDMKYAVCKPKKR